MDLDSVVVGGRGDLPGGVEGGVRDGQARFVLADAGGDFVGAAAGDVAEVPELERSVEGGGRDVMVL